MNTNILLNIISIIFSVIAVLSCINCIRHYNDEEPEIKQRYASLTLISIIGVMCITVISFFLKK